MLQPGTSQFVDCKTYATAYRRCPWASKVTKVYGGFIAFEFTYDYEVFKKQK